MDSQCVAHVPHAGKTAWAPATHFSDTADWPWATPWVQLWSTEEDSREQLTGQAKRQAASHHQAAPHGRRAMGACVASAWVPPCRVGSHAAALRGASRERL